MKYNAYVFCIAGNPLNTAKNHLDNLIKEMKTRKTLVRVGMVLIQWWYEETL